MIHSLDKSMTNLQKEAAIRSLVLVKSSKNLSGEFISLAVRQVIEAVKIIKLDTKSKAVKVFQNPDTTFLLQTLGTFNSHQKYWLCFEYYKMGCIDGGILDRTFDLIVTFLTAMGITEEHYLEIIKLAYDLE